MPLGIGTWSGGFQAQNSWHCGNVVSPVPPHPSPLPKGEGALSVAARDAWMPRFVATQPIVLPLLWGEGWGEGEWGCRIDAAAQSVFGTRETVPQFLAALNKNVRAPCTHHSAGKGVVAAMRKAPLGALCL